jgi:hypothetical protein
LGENFTAARSAHQLEMDRESVVKLTRAMKNRLNGIRNKKNKERKKNFDSDPTFFFFSTDLL